jgi:hypothetical protein
VWVEEKERNMFMPYDIRVKVVAFVTCAIKGFPGGHPQIWGGGGCAVILNCRLESILGGYAFQ